MLMEKNEWMNKANVCGVELSGIITFIFLDIIR